MVSFFGESGRPVEPVEADGVHTSGAGSRGEMGFGQE